MRSFPHRIGWAWSGYNFFFIHSAAVRRAPRRLVFELLVRDFFRFYATHHGRRVFLAYGTRGAPPVDFRDPARVILAAEWSCDRARIDAWYVHCVCLKRR